MNCTMIHGSTNVKFKNSNFRYINKCGTVYLFKVGT